YFFFSSRRRHTRFSRDWSSDVCSSDLFLNFSSLVYLKYSCWKAISMDLRFLDISGTKDDALIPRISDGSLPPCGRSHLFVLRSRYLLPFVAGQISDQHAIIVRYCILRNPMSHTDY